MTSSNHLKSYYVICYDISDHKKRRKAFTLMSNYGIKVQRSVFEAYLDNERINQLYKGVKKYIDETDSLRIYKLTNSNYNNKLTIGVNIDFEPEKDIII